MPDIRYVCLSDMHLGAKDSVLTNLRTASTDTDPSSPSPVMQQLVICLRDLISTYNKNPQKPVLVLNGDILELALSTTNEAAMAFERFIELTMPPGNELFEKIIYIPGNHDHHLWETARETQYVEFFKNIKSNEYLPIPWHTTNIFTNPVQSYFLTNIIQRYPHLERSVINTSYPNFGVINGRKCVVFHHGHYVETIYHLMTELANMFFPGRSQPMHVWDIEFENYAWIDFFWSTMGQSGDAGKDVEIIYDKLQDKDALKGLLSNFVKSLIQKYGSSGLGGDIEDKVLEMLFNLLVDKFSGTERMKTDGPLSGDAQKGLWSYMNGPLHDQIDTEFNQNMPSDLTFVFGHTHKPYQEQANFKGYPQWVGVYNSGGWVVDTVDPEPLHGGAIILVDENLDTVSLRMYNENNDIKNYSVKVEEALHPGEVNNSLYAGIQDYLNKNPDKWNAFSQAAAVTVSKRAQNLRARLNEKP